MSAKYYKTICHFTKVFPDGRSVVVCESSAEQCQITTYSTTYTGTIDTESSKEEFEAAFERVMGKMMEEALR